MHGSGAFPPTATGASDAPANTASIFDLVDEDAKLRAIDEGIAAIEAGDYVKHEVVREWLKKLATGEFDAPPPRPAIKP